MPLFGDQVKFRYSLFLDDCKFVSHESKNESVKDLAHHQSSLFFQLAAINLYPEISLLNKLNNISVSFKLISFA